jgi:hypothetical protein
MPQSNDKNFKLGHYPKYAMGLVQFDGESRTWRVDMKPTLESPLDNHSTVPAQERGRRRQPSDDDWARWR